MEVKTVMKSLKNVIVGIDRISASRYCQGVNSGNKKTLIALIHKNGSKG